MAATNGHSTPPRGPNEMPRRPHLELFNSVPSEEFHRFPTLPSEIRIMIWKYALQRNRLLQFHLEYPKMNPDEQLALMDTFSLAGYSTDRYRIIVRPMAPLSSELLAVSREARHAAEQFYPVKLPCYIDRSLVNNGVELIETELPLNLSFDYVKVDGPSDLVPFLFKHVQKCDPQGQGIQHLVLSGEQLPRPGWSSPPYLAHLASSLGSSPSIAELGAAVIGSFVKNIRSIWFTGSMTGGRAIDATMYISNKSNSFNYSLPLYPEFTFFDAPKRDPRPVHRDLSAVPTNDTSILDRTWLADNLKYRTGILLQNLDTAAIDFRLIVASLPGSRLVNTDMQRPRTQTREQASECLHIEDFNWMQWLWSYQGWDTPSSDGLGGGFLPAGCFGTASGLRPRPPRFDGPEMLATVPRPALGFWLFPLDESKDENGPYHPGYMRSYDGLRNLSGHWPDLALAHLRS